MFQQGIHDNKGFSGCPSGKEPDCQYRRPGFDPWVGMIPLEETMATNSSILGESHGQRRLAGYKL